MPTSHASNNVREHGVIVDEHKKRVRCNYCSKEMTSYSRLKQHLGGKGGDVRPCAQVPEDVKIQMNNMVSREMMQLFHSEVPRKETINPNSTSLKRKPIQLIVSKKKKPVENKSPSIAQEAESSLKDSGNAANNPNDVSRQQVKRCIARFFYENDIDFGAAKSRTFEKMVGAIIDCGSSFRFEIPSGDELNVCIQDEMNDVHHYVDEVRQSWKSTGCSILLDGWTDDKGKSLIDFLVDCPKGPMYLKSADDIHDVDTMVSLLSSVVEDVGVENVVQVITCTPSEFMAAVGKRLVEKYRNIFWTVCASHCITLMLDKIATMEGTMMEDVLSKANAITQFIYSDDALLRLLKKKTHRDLKVFSSSSRTHPFLTLERMVFECENLKALFGSWKCTSSRVANLVDDPSFWADARLVLKATIPLVRSLLLVSGGDKKPQMPYIYETMDQVKETIKEEFKSQKAKYLPYWQVIDEIWDNTLHSPLHSAGYFLNPSFFYSTDFLADAEVASGLLCCIVRMVKDQRSQDLVSSQLDEYREANGAFGTEMAIEQRTTLPPATWWSLHGGDCPDLQKFAVRILCQTCSGASKYDIKRRTSDQEAFIHHNLCLQQHSVPLKSGSGVSVRNRGPVWTDSDEAVILRGVVSSFEPKEEPL